MLEHKGTITIETERLILRRFTVKDAQDMFDNWANDEEVTKYLTWPTHKDPEITKSLLSHWVDTYNQPECYQWAIVPKALGKVIGSISVVEISTRNENCEVGYCIGKKFWGNGITTEALKAVLHFLFKEVGFERVQASHVTENVGSGVVMVKSGMRYEGKKHKSHKNHEGKFVDCDFYGILREDMGL